MKKSIYSKVLLRFIPFPLLLIVVLWIGSPSFAFQTQEGKGEPILLAASTVTAPGTVLDKPGPVARAEKVRRSILADADGDGLSDGLQAGLAAMGPDELVDVVVTFTEKGSADSVQKNVGPFRVKREFKIIPAFAATMRVAQARGLAKAAGVFRIEEDFKVKTMLDAANRDFGTEAARSEFTATGIGIGIAVVDTGVDPSHEMLTGGKVVVFVDCTTGSGQCDIASEIDGHGHGTHVASIAAGAVSTNYEGVAPESLIYGVKVLDASGSGTESDVIAGVEWCATQPGVHIINLSLGSSGSSDGRDALSRAVDSAVKSGKVVVVAAGNSGASPESVGSPGAAKKAITVGAAAEWSAAVGMANRSDGVYLAPFSSRGPTADGRIKPDIVAPGVSITAAQAGTNGYVTWSGTSMATPFVSGTVALALNQNSSLTPAQVKELLMASAQDRGSAGIDNEWGAGLLDGYRFVSEAFVLEAGGIPGNPHAFPTYQRMTGVVPKGGVKEFSFDVGENDLNVPIAATITITSGDKICLFGIPIYCDLLGGWAWTPDFDAVLLDPNENEIVSSICPLGAECGTFGRQETLHTRPEVAGTYTVRVYQFPDDPGGIQEGGVALDISTGPLAGADGGTVNSQPELETAILDQTTMEDTEFSLDVAPNFSDPDGDALTFSATGLPNSLAISSAGQISGTPNNDDALALLFDVTVTATDPSNSYVSDSFILTVANVNDPPEVVAPIPDHTAIEGDVFTLDVSGNFHDPDGDVLTFSSTGLPVSLTINSETGVIGGTPTNQDVTDWPFEVTVTVTDPSGSRATIPFTLNVDIATSSGATMHIGDLDGLASSIRSQWQASVTVEVHGADHSPVSHATVIGDWIEGYEGSGTCVTDGVGQCTLSSGQIKKNKGSMTFKVTGVTHLDLTFEPADNHDLDGDSDGTSITIAKP